MFIGKITVIDAPCGQGKTSWAIQEMIENVDRAYVFCTPFLSEINRVREKCGKHRIREPLPYNGRKIDDFNDLLAAGRSVAVSHSTFLNATAETMEAIQEGEYTLILDEVLDVVQEFNKIQSVEDSPRQTVTEQDMKMLIDRSMVKIHPDCRVEWCGGEYGDFKFSEVKRFADKGVLYLARKKLFVAIFPPEIFRKFDRVFVLTYMFDASMLKYYFQMFGLETECASIYIQNGHYAVGAYSEDVDRNFRQRFRELVTLCDDPSLNTNPGLTKSWYQKAQAADFDQLKKNLSKFFYRHLDGVKAQDIMWSCPAEYEKKLKGKGYTRSHNLTKEENALPHAEKEKLERKSNCFVPCNSRASNDFENRWALAYLCNMWPNTMSWGFLEDNGIEPDKKQFALSCLIQWVCRSRIRKGQPVSLYLPSNRMRSLLINWMNG